MNKKMITVLGVCIALSMLLCACITGGEQETSENETTLPVETTEATTAATEESVPGVVENPFDDEPTADDSAESSGDTNNNESDSSANTGDSGNNTGSNNSGNSGSDKDEKPEETQPSTEETTQPEVGDEVPSPNEVTYEEYNAMSGEEQMAFFNSFDSMEDFVAWYNAAKAKYEAEHPDIEVGDGNIDIGDIVGGGN